MKIKEIKDSKTEELQKELESLSQELFQTKRDIRDGKEKNVKKSLRIKRIIARIQTVLNERQRSKLN